MPEAWSRLVEACAGDFKEKDLLALYWDSVSSLCKHYGIHSPVDLATIELHWKRNQRGTNASETVTSSSSSCKDRSASLGNTLSRHNTGLCDKEESTRIPRRTSITRMNSSTSNDLQNSSSTSLSRHRSSSLVHTTSSRGEFATGPTPTDLQNFFETFCAFGGNTVMELDGAKCVKLCKDVGIIGTKVSLSSTDVELIFAKVRRKGERRITYTEFRQGFLPEVAKRSNRSVEEIVQLCERCEGPTVQATKSESVRFYPN